MISKPQGTLKLLAKTGATIAVVVFIISKLGWQAIVSTIATAHLPWLFYALLIFIISCWFGAWQWQLLLKNKGVHAPFRKIFSLYFVGMFFNNFALGSITGDAVRIAYLKMNSTSGKPAFAATFLDRFAGLWAMLGFAVVGSILLIKQKSLEMGSMTLATIALSVTFLLFCGIMMLLISRRLQRIIDRILDALPLPKKGFIKQVIDQTVLERKDLHLLAPIAVLSTSVQLMRVVVHILCGMALGLPISSGNIHYFFIFVPLLAILMILPLPFGVREGAGGTLFTAAGFQLHPAMVMGFLASLVGITASLLGGILFIIQKSTFSDQNINAVGRGSAAPKTQLGR